MRLSPSQFALSLLAVGVRVVISQPRFDEVGIEKQVSAACPTIPSPVPAWSQLPQQSTMPDPFLPLGYTTTSNVGNGSLASFQQAVMTGKATGRIKTPEEWYSCRQPEIIRMLQEYQYGYYPDHSMENVTAIRSENNVNITVTAFAKTGTFAATLQLPSGASATKPAPVVINIGGMDNAPYLSAGIAIVGFDYAAVAADSNSKSGAFWSIYNGRDIGTHILPSCVPTWPRH